MIKEEEWRAPDFEEPGNGGLLLVSNLHYSVKEAEDR